MYYDVSVTFKLDGALKPFLLEYEAKLTNRKHIVTKELKYGEYWMYVFTLKLIVWTHFMDFFIVTLTSFFKRWFIVPWIFSKSINNFLSATHFPWNSLIFVQDYQRNWIKWWNYCIFKGKIHFLQKFFVTLTAQRYYSKKCVFSQYLGLRLYTIIFYY